MHNGLAEKMGKSWKARLRQTIDKVLPKVSTFDEFLEAMRQEGYEVVQSKKILKFRAQGQERFTRSKTLGTDYTLEALQERIGKTQLLKRKKTICKRTARSICLWIFRLVCKDVGLVWNAG